MSNPISLPGLKKKRILSLVSFSIEGDRWHAVHLKRTNGSVTVEKKFSLALPSGWLAADPAATGQEILTQLKARGVEEKNCVVALPLKWVLTASVALPQLEETDVESFLQIEAERSFSADLSELQRVTSRVEKEGASHATLIAFPSSHLATLESILRAAQLRPLSFSLGIAMLQPAGEKKPEGILALQLVEGGLNLQVTAGGGILSLRALDGSTEEGGGPSRVSAETVAREIRITLGELPADLRPQVRRARIFGPTDLLHPFTQSIQARLSAMGLSVETPETYATNELGLSVPPATLVNAETSLGTRFLRLGKSDLEFLPPKVSAWQLLAARYSQGKLQKAALIAGALVVLGVLFVLAQQWELWKLGSEWSRIREDVVRLEETQQRIRQFRGWYDEGLGNLRILELLTKVFPEDGVVSAKTIEIREQGTVTCIGQARDNQSLIKMLDRLRASQEVSDVKLDRIQGKSPIQFTFDFRWVPGGMNAN